MFKTSVESVTITNVKGKEKRFGRFMGRRLATGRRRTYASLPGRKSISRRRRTDATAQVKPTRRAAGLGQIVTPGLHKGEPHWPLVTTEPKGVGRTTRATTMRHKGGNHKQHYRLSISGAIRRRRRDGPSDRVTPTAVRTSRCCCTPTERRCIIAPRRRGRHATHPIGSPTGGIRCRCARSVGTTVHCTRCCRAKAHRGACRGAGAQLLRARIVRPAALRSGEIRKVRGLPRDDR
jgi:large subunit ribosomal protein L2